MFFFSIARQPLPLIFMLHSAVTDRPSCVFGDLMNAQVALMNELDVTEPLEEDLQGKFLSF